MSTSLLPNEIIAAEFVTKIGITRAHALLNKIAERFDRRYKKACANSFSTVDRGSIRVTAIESELMHRVRIGLMICDNSDSPEAARQRNLERRRLRAEQRLTLKSA
ncbi:hypothetical protein OTK49_20865 [Vibrio coralliirubri]|uniref:hypothetical protein n=1 Tax=Vibrio coralliirubri TaxID=1516159 RepID=UPI00228482A6|nr:hypothetical protein [Vibrio coralliirubri]MCY9864971.1 hypothetical protein [Vibrio coralliirubri]